MTQRLLIVDDDSSISLALKHYFLGAGYNVDCAAEREEAEALLAKHEYELLVADLRLSPIRDNDGLDLVAYTRERSPRTKIVVLTANGSRVVQDEAQDRGAHRYLNKPIRLPKLAQAVAQLLAAAT